MSNLNAGAGHRERFQPHATRDRWGTLSSGGGRRIPCSKFVPLSRAAQAREDAILGEMRREYEKGREWPVWYTRILKALLVILAIEIFVGVGRGMWSFLRWVWKSIA